MYNVRHLKQSATVFFGIKKIVFQIPSFDAILLVYAELRWIMVAMIYSTGIDLVDIDRIQKGYRCYREKFLDRLYSPAEVGIIKSRKANMIVTMAGKFAAKEAVMKALVYFFDEGVYLRDIEILNRPSGIPYVRLPQKTEARLAGKKILISISHEKKYAVATAIICDEE